MNREINSGGIKTNRVNMAADGVYHWLDYIDGGNQFASITPNAIRLGSSNQQTTPFSVQLNHTTGLLNVVMKNLPTSKDYLPSGTLWRDGETLKIVT